jgi:GNAT superfamily N-acetyltransferase
MPEEISLRNLTTRDIPAAFELSTEAGWNQTQEDWRTLIEVAPGTCLGIEVANQLVSTSTLICYGQRLAWIGMVLTRSSHRGKGYAMRLLNQTLRMADEMGIASVKLDATDQGQPLYEKLGFRAEQYVERWERNSAASPGSSGQMVQGNTRMDLERDRNAFGADRSSLLHRLSQQGPFFAQGQAFLLTRPGRTHRYLGPCISDSSATAGTLIDIALGPSLDGDWYWDVMINNARALALASELGFAPKRRLLRMVRGKDLRGDEASIYALGGFEFG